MIQFVHGALMIAYIVAGLFFLRFRQKTRDRFFTLFAIAFGLLAVEKIPLAFFNPLHEDRYYVYLFRLLAFSVILFAIFDKNRRVQHQG